MAGSNWFNYFMKRHPNLSVRTPKATNLAKASRFNRINVRKFFELLKIVFNRFKLTAHDVWNMNETGVTTVQKPDRVVARRGFKQIGRVISAKRGSLGTVATCVSAGGCSIPPFFIFPRVNYKPQFVTSAPCGSNGDDNKSG
ncbi:uncharacterized protein LOC129219051 [Uloborus diversus]|uniref:uncharacterized protein LOC129219051 n=1 Tax=Uloborus diversus TaxID=327109 RepID=UPI0024096C94|nr:uncharacterized protein LOC129219051 [Uloborus diversus]